MKKVNNLQKALFRTLYKHAGIFGISVIITDDNVIEIMYVDKTNTCWEYYIYPNGTIEKY